MSHQSKTDRCSNHQSRVPVVAPKLGLVSLLLSAVVLLTGCFKFEIDYIFRDDGSATILTRSAMDLRELNEAFGWLLEEKIECDESALATNIEGDIMTQFEAFGDWVTNDVVDVNISLKEIGNECIAVSSETVPPGTLPNSFDDGVLRVYKHANERWSIQLVSEERFEIPVNPYDTSKDLIPDLDPILEDASIRVNIRLPGTGMNHNAHTVSTSNGSTKFEWYYKGAEELKSTTDFIHSAHTEPSTAQSAVVRIVLIVSIAVVVVTASGLLVIRTIKKGSSDSADDASDEA